VPGAAAGSWMYNTSSSSTLNPFFHAAWTDNRDVRPPANGDWTNYTPLPLTGYTQPSGGALPTCVVGQAGMRNQNIYTSRITGGLTVLAPGNSKQLSTTLQRAFSVVVQNNTNQPRYYRLIIANQPAQRTPQLLALGFRPDVIAMSGELGVEKPDPAFFRRGLQLMGEPDPARVAYVGDRIDRDVEPSRRAGLRPVWIRRGPWGRLQVDRGRDAAMVVESLDEFVDRVGEL